MNYNFGVNFAFMVIFCGVNHTPIMDYLLLLSVMVLLSLNKSI